VRIIIDKHLKIPEYASVFNHKVSTIVLTENGKEEHGNLLYETMPFSENSVQEICDILYRHHIQSLIVEGGAKTIQSFINSNIWDEARVFIGDKNMLEGLKAPKIQKDQISEEKIKNDTLIYYKND
jgi:diaminohydroxyphosphoribosylaminopyrimidine deaminase/5-amino-6-(5-phosphoribosylamino)uracil reductase